MKQSKKLFSIIAATVAFIVGCSDDAATTSTTPAQPQQSSAYNSYEELIANAVCNESVNGIVAYTALENANFICSVDAATGAWIWALVQPNVPQTEQPVQSGENNIQNCPYGILADGSCNNGLPSNWNEYANGTAKEVEEGPGYVTDLRWGRNKTYRTVTIGGQVWMAEDIDVSGNCGNSGYWSYLGGYCEPEYGTCETSWSSAFDLNFYGGCQDVTSCENAFSKNIQGVCPVGWHIPKESEWKLLVQSLGDSFEENKFAQAGFPVNFCGSSFETYFWTSSPNYNYNYNNGFVQTKPDGSVVNMAMFLFMFSKRYGSAYPLPINVIDRTYDSSTDKEIRARVRCVKDQSALL